METEGGDIEKNGAAHELYCSMYHSFYVDPEKRGAMGLMDDGGCLAFFGVHLGLGVKGVQASGLGFVSGGRGPLCVHP